jgi:hypothetical protein
MVIAGPVRRGLRFQTTRERQRSGMTTTELRAKIRAVQTGGLFFRLLTR